MTDKQIIERAVNRIPGARLIRCSLILSDESIRVAFNPLESHDDAQLLIDEAGRLGLWGEFTSELRLQNDGWEETHYWYADMYLSLSPRQKTLAAIAAIEKKEADHG